MPHHRRLIAYLALSADGFIARPDHDVSWLPSPAGEEDYGMGAFFKTIDTVVLGRKTWEIGKKLGQDSYPGVKNYVVSREPHDAPNVEFVSDLGALARDLRAAGGKDVWIVGGGEIFGALLDLGELDALVLHVIPVLIGEGIPLLGPKHRHVQMQLEESHVYEDGTVRLSYRIRD